MSRMIYAATAPADPDIFLPARRITAGSAGPPAEMASGHTMRKPFRPHSRLWGPSDFFPKRAVRAPVGKAISAGLGNRIWSDSLPRACYGNTLFLNTISTGSKGAALYSGILVGLLLLPIGFGMNPEYGSRSAKSN